MTTTVDAQRWPDTFIVGAPKSGTTSLHRYLQGHPQVYMSRLKEPGYFAPDVTGIRKQRRFYHPKDEAEYLGLFANAGKAERVGESSTIYLMSKVAPGLINALGPAVRIIAMVRNPVDLVYSLHNERVSDEAEWITDFETAIDADDDRRAGKRLPSDGGSGYGVAYRDSAMLGGQVGRWLEVFGRDRVHVIVYDDFVSQTEQEFAKVLQFLGVDDAYRPETFDAYNTSHRRRSRPITLLLRNRVTRWFARAAVPAVIGEDRTSALAKRVGLRRLNRKKYERPPLDPGLRRRLESEFADDVAKLGALLGRDLLSEWFTAAAQPEATLQGLRTNAQL